jgi:energy-coupling factor transporter ATP-binding protein EcfA2
MIETLAIRGFRGHQQLTLSKLGAVNLLVGPNNAGKTAVLDAVELLVRDAHPRALGALAYRRGGAEGEYRTDQATLPSTVQHLFYGHGLSTNGNPELQIVSNGKPERKITLTLADQSEELQLPDSGTVAVGRDTLAVSKIGYGNLQAGGMTLDPKARSFKVQFITPWGNNARALTPLWDSIVGNPEEDEVVRALQLVDPAVRRVVFTEQTKGEPQIFVLRAGEARRVPLATMGDGMRRMLGIAMRAIHARGGFLLLDEVESGLHFSAMHGVWRWLAQYAKDSGTQVFATTHSNDCVHALGWLNGSQPELSSICTLYRLLQGEPSAIRYSASELRVVADEDLEVRG